MQTAGARVLGDDNEMSREAVLSEWERKIEVAESRDSGRFVRSPEEQPAPTRRFERAARPVLTAVAEPESAERRTITITGQSAAAPRRRYSAVEAQLAQPDRIALWAFLLGLVLVAIAAGTAHA